MCSNRACGYRFHVVIDVERDNVQETPVVCPNPEPLKNGKPCPGSTFTLQEAETVRIDYQEIRIQEAVRSVDVGSIPRSLCVVLQHDLVDIVKAGDDVMLGGIIARRWRRISPGARCDVESVMKANSITSVGGSIDSPHSGQVPEQAIRDFADFWAYFRTAPLRGRDVILRSICPQLCGMRVVKLAVALTLAGGVGYRDDAGAASRGEPHLLLVGDPGTGKSQFLRFAAKMNARAVLTTGIGSTSAGLTCTAVRDGKEWALEAGALVLADRGVCCIDEFNTIREHDRTAIHEAMEQQSISVAKAGMVVKLNSRCSILAACNPRGKFEVGQDISVNTSIASPLLSRFDTVLILVDELSPEWDREVSSFILGQACSAAADLSELPVDAGDAVRTSGGTRVEDASAGVVWSLGRMQAYFSYVRGAFNPSVSPEAQRVLQAFYAQQRASDGRSAARTTIRLLESLIRMTQAHARLCMREVAGVQDAAVAVVLAKASMGSLAMGPASQSGMNTFEDDPDGGFAHLQEQLLQELKVDIPVAQGSIAPAAGTRGL